MDRPDYLEIARDGEATVAVGRGRWDLAAALAIDARLRDLARTPARRVRLDLAHLDGLDTAGAWLIHRTVAELHARGIAAEATGLAPGPAALVARIARLREEEVAAPPEPWAALVLLDRVGRVLIETLQRALELVGFFGEACIGLARTAAQPRRLRFVPLVAQLEQVGLNAMPIVGLLCFLVGVVLAYQSADQLRRFGAEIYAVNLLGVSVLREIGILITAIIVAGRSGSAFTAQIGTMKVNQEVDAMMTLGLDPMEVLVLPRVLALVIALPLLAFFGDVMALVGGGVICYALLDLSVVQFLRQLSTAVTLTTFWVGMVKAPVFALIIALVGCFEGLQVSGSAESVGRLTTRSVVESIFIVIVADAGFSILFSILGV